jgi:hypothetical protein
MMNVVIPVVTHYMYTRKVSETDMFLLDVYDVIIATMFDIDIYSKLYETASTTIAQNVKDNPLWERQDIRGIDPSILTIATVQNILLNIIPKYAYNKNIVSFNFNSVKKTINYQVTGIEYEYEFVPLSSSKRDEENTSEFDKFESYLEKQDEARFIQNKANSKETMRRLRTKYGPISEEEIKFCKKHLIDEKDNPINQFQKELIMYLFYKEFGDVASVMPINIDDYITLMIIAKKILQARSMVVLPYIVSSKVTKIIGKKIINKRDLIKLQSSPFYAEITQKYRNDKIVGYILSLIATILASEFKIISYDEPELHGTPIKSIQPEILCEEVLMYIMLI